VLLLCWRNTAAIRCGV